MASIRESGTGKRRRFVVGYRNEITRQNATARLDTLDEAMQFFWRVEISEHQFIPLAGSAETVRRWPVQKAVWFWLGYQYGRAENHTISLGSYEQYRKQLAVLPPELLRLRIDRLTPHRLSELTITTQKYLRFAFGLLVTRHWLAANPVGRLSGRTSHKINLPEKKTIVAMLGAADNREKLAILLAAVCGLRPSELMALRYSDVSRDKIILRRHLTPQGEKEGTKRSKEGRKVDMPEEVWHLLDKSLLGTRFPVMTGRYGQPLSLNYSKRGVMRELLNDYGIGRYYDLRHFAITNLLRRGATMADAAKFAGHKDASITAAVYAHFLEQEYPLTGSLSGG